MKYKITSVIVLVLAIALTTQSVKADQWLFVEEYINFPVGNGLAVGIGDFNSDGLKDVALTTSAMDLFIFLQNPDGTLANPPVHFSTPGEPWSLAVGDLNNDGRSDIAVSSHNENIVSVYYQRTDGNLFERNDFPVNNGPDAIAVGDVNGDGRDDIAVSHWYADNIGIFTQAPDGTLNPMVSYESPQAGYDDIEIADINNDGKNDVIKMNGLGEYPSLSVYTQDANGVLAPDAIYPLANCASYTYCLGYSIGTGDATGDGLTDIVLGFGYSGTSWKSEIALFAQDANGSLQAPNFFPADNYPEAIKVADINSDGFSDVLTTYSGQIGVFLQQNGSLIPHAPDYFTPYTNHYKPQGLDVGDINNDSQPDLVLAHDYAGLVVLYHTESTPPTISVTAVKDDGSSYIPGTWTNQTVTVKYTCNDEDSGIASCPADQIFSADGITAETIGTAVDNVGNSANANFGPIQIDKTPPALFIGVSPNPILLNGNAELLTNAADMLSGINPGAMPCSNIDTNSVGVKSVSCYVSDNAGNTTMSETEYQVIYDFDGFLNPLTDCINNACADYDVTVVNPGSTLPVKFQLKDANGDVVQAMSDPIWLAPANFSYLPTSLPNDYEFQMSSETYKWKKNHQNYVYEWSTKGLPDNSIWLVGVRLDDGMTHYVFVVLAK